MPESLAEIADALKVRRPRAHEDFVHNQAVERTLCEAQSVLAAQVQGCKERLLGGVGPPCGSTIDRILRCPACRFRIEFGWGTEEAYEKWKREKI